MVGVADDHHALRSDDAPDFAAHLRCQALLHLQAAGEDIDKSRNLAESDNPSVRDVGDGNLAEERQDMVLAHRIELDVLDHDDTRSVVIEQCLMDDGINIGTITRSQIIERLGRPDRSLQQTFTRTVFAQQAYYFLNVISYQINFFFIVSRSHRYVILKKSVFSVD